MSGPEQFVSDAEAAARTTIATSLPHKLAECAPTIHGDEIVVSWTFSVVPHERLHPITQEAEASVGALLNLWVGPSPTGRVVTSAPMLPQVFAIGSPDFLDGIVTEALEALDRSYQAVRHEFTGQPLDVQAMEAN